MNTRREGAVTIIANPEEGDEFEQPIKTEADAALEDFVEKARKIGSTAKIIIHKLDKENVNANEIFCGQYPVDQYDYFDLLEMIQNTWGRGLYRMYCTMKGRKGLIQNQLIRVGDAPGGGNLPALAGEGNNINTTILRMMQENNEKLMEAMKPKEAAGMTETLQQLLLFKQVLGQDAPQKSALASIKEMVEVMALMKDMSGGGDSEGGMGGMLIKAVEALGPVAVMAMQTRQAAPRQFPQPAPQIATPQAVPQNAPIDVAVPLSDHFPEGIKMKEDKTNELAMVNQLIALLDTVGPNVIDPATVAEKVIESVADSDEKIALLAKWASEESAYKQMQELNPRIDQYSEWVHLFIEHMRAQLGFESSVADEYDLEEGDPKVPVEHIDALEAPLDTVEEIKETPPHD